MLSGEEPEEYEEPTNVPDDLEERAERVYDYVSTATRTAKQYVYPMQDPGPKDYALILDLMGLDVGTLFRRTDTDRTMVVLSIRETEVNWPDGKHPGRKLKVATFAPGDRFCQDGETQWLDEARVLKLWEAFIYGDVDVIGKVSALGSEGDA